MEASGAGTGANKKRRRCGKIHWTHEEDKLLTELVKRHGPWNWGYIADHINGRTGMSCRLRWLNHLNPKVDKKPFSKEEQERLLELRQEFGNRWASIVGFFPGRTDGQLKNQYHVLMARQNIKALSPSFSTSPQPDKTKVPLLSGGFFGRDDTRFAECSSNLGRYASAYSICGRDSAFVSINHGIVDANVGVRHGGDITISDARSAGLLEHCPAHEPPKGASVGKNQLFDFMGVGNSE